MNEVKARRLEALAKYQRLIAAVQATRFTGGYDLENKDICDFECEFLLKTQNNDGSWKVTWDWVSYPEEWAISKNWWKSDIIIKNIKYIKEFD